MHIPASSSAGAPELDRSAAHGIQRGRTEDERIEPLEIPQAREVKADGLRLTPRAVLNVLN
jgi:hypothetical protein